MNVEHAEINVHLRTARSTSTWALILSSGSRLTGLDERSARTVAFKVGMQNARLASGIALEMNRIVTLGLAPAVFGPWMNISSSSLATWWRDWLPFHNKQAVPIKV